MIMHRRSKQPAALVIGAAILALGMSAFVFYEPGPGRGSSLPAIAMGPR
jgi:hypothetical protein